MMSNRCHCCGRPLEDGESMYHGKCMRQLFGSRHIPALDYSTEELNELAQKIVISRISVPGVQPKLSLHLEKAEGQSNYRLTLVGLEGEFILKPPVPAWPFLPEAEHFCMNLARHCGISTVEFGLIPLKSGELSYVTRRMDRTKDGPLHLEDFCQILNKMTEQKYNGSMEQVGKAIRLYSDVPGLDLVRFFELSVFCFLTGNSDMHLKNFSLLRCMDGHYELSPAYDLVPVRIIMPEDLEELALTLNGKKNRIALKDFLTFGRTMKLSETQVQRTLERITSSIKRNLRQCMEESFMPQRMNEEIASLIATRMQLLTV